MPRTGIQLISGVGLGVLLLIGNPVRVAAATVVVPGDYATIQGAIDSSTADVVQIKDGDYAERLVVGRSVTLEPRASESSASPESFPSVLGLSLSSGSSPMSLTCLGIRFRGAVVLSPPPVPNVSWQSCRFDSGLIVASSSTAVLRLGNCVVLGGAALNGMSVRIRQCVFIGGLTVSAEGLYDVRGNYVAGPAAVGIQATSYDAGGTIEDNLIVGTQDGLVSTSSTSSFPSISRNEVRDCSGTAYRVSGGNGPVGPLRIVDNRAHNCGGNGIEVSARGSSIHVAGNLIDSVGGQGILLPTFPALSVALVSNTVIHAGKCGIASSGMPSYEGAPLTVSDNRVIDAGADGLRVVAPSLLERNVVGRCAGAGIVVDTARVSGGMVVRSNTVYLNTGSGLRLHGSVADSVHRNIASANSSYGLEWTSAVQPAVFCNDWYGNSLSPTLGVSLGATDLQLSPLFCDLPRDVVTLSAVSALADAPGCGLIGALGMGCSYPAVVEEGPALQRRGLNVMPQPSRGVVRFAWRELSQPTSLEIYDVAGARHWRSDVAPGQQEFCWSGTDRSGRPLPAGVYFVRLVGPSLDEKQRLVLVR